MSDPHPRLRPPVALLVAAGAGLVHAAVSAYWAAGGDSLVETLGATVVDRFADLRWLLWIVAAVKVAGALGPLVLDRHAWLAPLGRPARRLSRGVCWAGAAVLVAWGGLNTVAGATVLAGVIRPDGGYDEAAMVGHALLWDPLFLVWGLALAAGLRSTRPSRAPDADRVTTP